MISLLALLSAQPVLAEPVELRRYVLVAGADDGGAERVQLQYATTDASSFASVLSDLGEVSDTDLIVLQNPSRTQLVEGIEALHDRIEADGDARTEAIVYYSGHSDERGLMLGEERLPYNDFKRAVETLPSDVTIAVLDSCASGAMVRTKGGIHKAPFLVDESAGISGHAYITSASATEAAQESDRIQGSFFTHYLVSGLRGGADVDGNNRVTLNEAYRFAFDETLRRTEGTFGGAQHASYDIQLMGSGDLVMTDLRDTSAGLRLPPEMEGRFFVRDHQNHLQAELYKPLGQPVLLGLSPGRYQVSVEQEVHFAHAVVQLEEGDPMQLSPLNFVSLAPEGTTVRGDLLPGPEVRDRFRGNPMMHRSFVAASTVSTLTALALYSLTFQVNMEACQGDVDCMAKTRGLNNNLLVGAGVFGGIGAVTGVSAVVTIPEKKKTESKAEAGR